MNDSAPVKVHDPAGLLPTIAKGRPLISEITKIVDAKLIDEARAESDRQNEFLLDRVAGVHELVMLVERQKDNPNISRFGAYTLKAIEGLVEELFRQDHIVILPAFMAGATGKGFEPLPVMKEPEAREGQSGATSGQLEGDSGR
jgi:hypothetical protein